MTPSLAAPHPPVLCTGHRADCQIRAWALMQLARHHLEAGHHTACRFALDDMAALARRAPLRIAVQLVCEQNRLRPRLAAALRPAILAAGNEVG